MMLCWLGFLGVSFSLILFHSRSVLAFTKQGGYTRSQRWRHFTVVTRAQDSFFNITLVISCLIMTSSPLSPNIQQQGSLLGRSPISLYLKQVDHPTSPHRSGNESYTPLITLFIRSPTRSPTALAAIYIDARDPTGNRSIVKQKIY